jgi:thiol-disulfide isomerase/thioredoxin
MKKSSLQYVILSFVLLLIGAVWIWISASPAGAVIAGQNPAPQAGFLAPDFNLPAYGGGVLSQRDLIGRPVVINFWASWCPPCRSEMPAMQRVHEEYQDQGLVILGINAANQDQMADAIDFAEQNGLTFPIIFDTGGRATLDYQVRSLPTTFFIDRKGLIQEIIVGGPISEALLRIRAEQLLREKP